MVLTSGQKTGYAVCLVLTILLVGLHMAVAATGHVFYKQDHDNINGQYYTENGIGTNYGLRDYNQFAAFLIIAAGLTFFISIILLIALCSDKFGAKVRHILATLNLLLEFAIAVAVSIAASQASNFRHYLSVTNFPENDDLQVYYKLAIADAVITFVLEVVYLVVIYLGTLGEIEHTVLLASTAPIQIENQPQTAQRFN